jgi:transposase
MQDDAGVVTMQQSVKHSPNGTGLRSPGVGVSHTHTTVSGQVVPVQEKIGDGHLNLPGAVLAELNWIASEGSPSLSRHARIVLARNEGRSLSEIAKVLDVDRATVRRWLIRFEQDGLRGLIHASTGKERKRRFDDSIRDAVARLAMAAPAAVGEPFSRWSLRRLRSHVMRRGIVRQISVEGLRQLLHGLPLPESYWRSGGGAIGPLSDEVRQGLETLARSPRREVARRARLVLARSRGLSEGEVATALNVGRSCVRRWLTRFERHGILGLQTARRPSHPLVFTPDVRAAIARHARTDPAQVGAAVRRWSLRSLRASLIRHKVVRNISVQHLRRIIAEAGVSLHGEAAPEPTSELRAPARR